MQYIPTTFWTTTRQWNRRTSVGLIVGDEALSVEVLRYGNQARFSSGWNAFVSGNELTAGSRLFFEYVGELEFEVRLAN